MYGGLTIDQMEGPFTAHGSAIGLPADWASMTIRAGGSPSNLLLEGLPVV